MTQRTTKTTLRNILSGQIEPSLNEDVDLSVDPTMSTSNGTLYRVRQDLPDGGVRNIGPAGHASEMEYFLRGLNYGMQIANGRHDEPADD